MAVVLWRGKSVGSNSTTTTGGGLRMGKVGPFRICGRDNYVAHETVLGERKQRLC